MKKLSLKRLLKKRNNGGFTLVEVIVSCALLSILVLGVMGFVGPVMNIIRVNEKNARATMLAETINSYINGCLKNAKMVEVFTLSDVGDIITPGVENFRNKTGGLNKIDDFMNIPGNEEKYEIRCLGASWMFGSGTDNDKAKIVLTNCTLNRNKTTTAKGDVYSLELKSMAGSPSTSSQVKVFDDALYDGLFPVINIMNFSATKDADGNYTGDNMNGYKVETEIYSDQKCYNILPAERAKSHLAFTGASYIQCVNMVEAGITKPASDIIPMEADLQHAIDGHGSLSYTSGDQTFYYPNTYIYYVVPKG